VRKREREREKEREKERERKRERKGLDYTQSEKSSVPTSPRDTNFFETPFFFVMWQR